jgi:hypothetical protein
MVTQFTELTRFAEKRDFAAHLLERVIELAKAESVDLIGQRVQRHRANLGYSHEAICECLSCLQPHHFRHSGRYEGVPGWYDVYRIEYDGPTGKKDDLYIKLKLTNGCLSVAVFSFHLDGQE